METIKFKKLRSTAHIPSRGTACAAGFDLYADITEPDATSNGGATASIIKPHMTKMIGTGIALEIPDGYFGAVFARSGIAAKRGLRPANCVGVVDSDYRGEIIVALHNDTDYDRIIDNSERIAQIAFIPYADVQFEEAQELSNTDRDGGGFGSTGA